MISRLYLNLNYTNYFPKNSDVNLILSVFRDNGGAVCHWSVMQWQTAPLNLKKTIFFVLWRFHMCFFTYFEQVLSIVWLFCSFFPLVLSFYLTSPWNHFVFLCHQTRVISLSPCGCCCHSGVFGVSLLVFCIFMLCFVSDCSHFEVRFTESQFFWLFGICLSWFLNNF